MFLITSTLLPCAAASFLISSSSVEQTHAEADPETNRNRIALKSLEQALEISMQYGRILSKHCLSLLYGIRTDHLTECSDSVLLKEHMLGTAKSDTLCAKLACFLCVCRRICIGTHL